MARRELESLCSISEGGKPSRSLARNMPVAIEVLDAFNSEAHWPLRSVYPLLGRMGVK